MAKAQNKTVANDASVETFLAAIADPQRRADAQAVDALMRKATGCAPKMWGGGIVGYDEYHYVYDSGREGDGHTIGFYPRKGKLTIYLMDGTARHSDLLSKLGKHSTTGYCVYIKRLGDVELPVLEQIVRDSYAFVESKSQEGPIRQILWKAES